MSSNLYGDGELVPAAGVLPGRAERSPLPFPISTPIDDPISQRSRSRPRRRSGRGCWLVLLIAIVLATAAGLAAYAYDPELPAQAMSHAQALILGGQPGTLGPAETITPGESNSANGSTDTPEAPGATATSLAEETIAAAVVGMIEASPTASPTEDPTPTATPTATPTPQPTPQGGGRQIAFASEVNNLSQIYLVNVDGTGLHQLTNLPEGACQPDWSPDGTRLVFISPCRVNQERYPGSALFLIDADGNNLVALKTQPGGDFDPDWSPDGKEIAFTTLRDGGRPRLYAYNLENDTVRPLSSPDMPYSYDMQPTFSSDGEKIAFVTTRKGPYQIWIMDRDSSNQELFSHSGSMQNFFPHWSPDGEAILYTQLVELGSIPRLTVAPVGDGGLREFSLNEDPIPMREAKYSPDGRWVVYESWPQGGNHDIYIAAANGAGSKVVVTEISYDFDPDWRPEPAP